MDRPNAAKRPAITPEPHARGDGPPSTTGKAATPPRAPRTWGWTAPARGATCRAAPSPTHVGMDRSAIYRAPATISKPHARGDGPPTGPSPTRASSRAPRTWGWTGQPSTGSPRPSPSPTHVGMDRRLGHRPRHRAAKPHARGDGPVWFDAADGKVHQAPRTWGWTVVDIQELERRLPS